ncbi:MAG: AMP phosphorylase [Candidatus Odinarchaeota archaeon]|nr:AMP phosphorylase [Candidatus Odinarchaeota archaeon]
MKLRAKIVDLEAAGKPIAILNKNDARLLRVAPLERVSIVYDNREIIALIDVTDTFVSEGEIGLFESIIETLKVKDNDIVDVHPAPKPVSISYIKRKMLREYSLTREQFFELMNDINLNRLSDTEIAVFISSVAINGLTDNEILDLIDALVNTGEQLNLSDIKNVVTKHSIGGIPGNRVTLLILPIVTAAGLIMPKLSTRAITSPSGTADTAEIFMPIDLTIDEFRKIILKVGGALASNERLGICPAMSKLIRILSPLALDPEPLLISSILAHMKALSAKHVVIDIPTGRGAKVYRLAKAQELGEKMVSIGMRAGVSLECVITPGDRPIGKFIGPALEAYDVLRILTTGKGSFDLKNKALSLAGILLEVTNIAEYGKGVKVAEEILESGKAWKKMMEIIEIQGGDPKVSLDDIPLGTYTAEYYAPMDGTVYGFDNRAIREIAKVAGAPIDKGAGVVLLVDKGDDVKKGQLLMKIYSNSEARLTQALKVAERRNPYIFEKMILGRITPDKVHIEDESIFGEN